MFVSCTGRSVCVWTQTRLFKDHCGWNSWSMWCMWCRRDMVGEHEGNNNLEDNIKMELQEIERNSVDWINLAQVTDKWLAHLSMIMNRGGEIDHWLRSWLLSRRTLLPGVSQSVRTCTLHVSAVWAIALCITMGTGDIWGFRRGGYQQVVPVLPWRWKQSSLQLYYTVHTRRLCPLVK